MGSDAFESHLGMRLGPLVKVISSAELFGVEVVAI